MTQSSKRVITAQEIIDEVQHGAGALLRGARTPRHVIDVAGRAMLRANDFYSLAIETTPPEFRPACREGCFWCCYYKVELTVPEVLALADHLKAIRSSSQLADLRARVAAVDAKTHGLDDDARLRARIACPLLVDGSCSAYTARPLACRWHNSLDVQICENTVEHPDKDYESLVSRSATFSVASVANGFKKAIDDAGLPNPNLELIAALRIVLEQSDAGARWLRGDSVFDSATAISTPRSIPYRDASDDEVLQRLQRSASTSPWHRLVQWAHRVATRVQTAWASGR